MCVEDLDEVLLIEKSAHLYPWTRGNFIDSIQNEHQSDILRNIDQAILGYFIVMYVQKEAHLLNISVHSTAQGYGVGKILLERMFSSLQSKKFESVLLEVQTSNKKAIYIYNYYGFIEIGRRQNYYLAGGDKREDAIIMRLFL
jgi:ribosomal-protein-alanine N-acetyltransferase